MIRTTLLFVIAVTLQAAVIRGTVVEHTTGKPLARATVTIQAIAGTPGGAATVRTNRFGGFDFFSLPAGAYVVTVSRAGFASAQYGQKEWRSSGHPVFLEEPAVALLEIRLRRLGAISGTLLDEEDIGLPDHEVVIYRNTRPPQLVERTKTDDRGVYRLGGLTPGSYLVRTAGKLYAEGSYVPTFHEETQELEQARRIDVRLDEQVDNINIKPREGRLVRISGVVLSPSSAPIGIMLVSDMGRIHQDGTSFHFENLPPGSYELYAQTAADSRSPTLYAGYATIAADRDQENIKLQLTRVMPVVFQFQGTSNQRVDLSKLRVLARSKDAAGLRDVVQLRSGQYTVPLAPGVWEVMVSGAPQYCVTSASAQPSAALQTARPDGWTELRVRGGEFVRFTLSASPATIRGLVISPAGEPVAGAPVFLDAWDARDRKRTLDLRQTRTDLRGRYEFPGLAPGTYRLLSTFEYQSPDPEEMEASGTRNATVGTGTNLQVDLSRQM